MATGSVLRPVNLMLRPLVAGLSLTLLTASLVAATAAAHEEPPPGIDVVQYFNAQDGALVLSPLAPSARNPTTWSTSGLYDPRRGLDISIPLNNSDPNFVVEESPGVDGWIAWSFKMTSTSSTPTLFGQSSKFAWSLVEGERSSPMLLDCRYGDPYYCKKDKKEPLYRAAFPGHEGAGKPHTHGDGTSADQGLASGDFEWLIRFTIAPCSTLSCPVLWTQYKYTFSVQIDGSTFVHYVAQQALPPPEPVPPVSPPASDENATTPPDGNQTGGNSTGPPSNETGNNTGGQGGNKSVGHGGGSAASRFLPSGYQAQAAGAASGLSAFAVAAGVAVAGLLLRRRSR